MRGVWRGLVASSGLSAAVVPAEYVLLVVAGPGEPPGPPPGHPERLLPHVPPTAVERALWDDIKAGARPG